MTSGPGHLGSVVPRSTKPKRLAAAFLKLAQMTLLSFTHAGNRTPYTSAALATIPQASRM